MMRGAAEGQLVSCTSCHKLIYEVSVCIKGLFITLLLLVPYHSLQSKTTATFKILLNNMTTPISNVSFIFLPTTFKL